MTLTLSVKTNVCFVIEYLKRCVKVGEKVVFNLDLMFLHLIMVGQQCQNGIPYQYSSKSCLLFLHQWSMNLVVIKGSKAVLIQKLPMQCYPLSPDAVIIVAQQLLYHVT